MERSEVTLDGHHYRYLTPSEEESLADLHAWWLARQGENAQKAWREEQ